MRSHPSQLSVLPFPRELRNRIYYHLFRGPWLVFGPARTQNLVENPAATTTDLGILRISKDTYSEASEMLYKVGNFVFRLPIVLEHGPIYRDPSYDTWPRMANITFIISAEAEDIPSPERRAHNLRYGSPMVGYRSGSNVGNIHLSLLYFSGTKTLYNTAHITFAEGTSCSNFASYESLGGVLWTALRELTGFRKLSLDLMSDEDKNLCYHNAKGKPILAYFDLGPVELKENPGSFAQLVFRPRQHAAEKLKKDIEKLQREVERLLG